MTNCILYGILWHLDKFFKTTSRQNPRQLTFIQRSSITWFKLKTYTPWVLSGVSKGQSSCWLRLW